MNWNDFTSLLAAPVNKLREFRDLPNQASDIADQAFPDSARDASMKNAYRHALGTGMMAQALGGGPLAAGFAKMAGYGWELPTLLDPRSTEAQRMDSRHDLNANSIGATLAQRTGSREELIQALKGFAQNSAQRAAPGIFERSPGYLTRSVR